MRILAALTGRATGFERKAYFNEALKAADAMEDGLERTSALWMAAKISQPPEHQGFIDRAREILR